MFDVAFCNVEELLHTVWLLQYGPGMKQFTINQEGSRDLGVFDVAFCDDEELSQPGDETICHRPGGFPRSRVTPESF